MSSRIIIFTGKGGVGKTMISSAHALASAKEGKKTLLVSTDMAHNLGDIFEVRAGSEIVTVRPDLDILEVDPDLVMRNDFPDFMTSWGNILASSGIKPKEKDQFTVMPGLEELFSLMKIVDLSESGIYDRIIVDCAPTGETLSMLKLPELLSWYFEKFFPVGRVAFRILSPITKTFFKVDMPDKDAMYDAEKMYLSMLKVQEALKDPKYASVRLVCTPEKMVVEETKRSFMYLNLYHYNVDGIYINRIIPKLDGNDFFLRWYDIQQKYLTELEQVFANVPIARMRWYPNEIRGMQALETFCEEHLKPETLDEVFSVRRVGSDETYTSCKEGYCLSLELPMVGEDELTVNYTDADLTIVAGQQVRVIPLPYTLKGSHVARTEFKNGKLSVIFAPGEEGFRI